MKFKTTKKTINENYSARICVGYCSIQHLLNYEDAVAYTTHIEGWEADIYAVGNVAIITGYAPFGNFRPSYDLCKKYNDAALEICCNRKITWEEQRDKVRELLNKFVKEAVQ